MLKDDALLEAIGIDYTRAGLDARRSAMLDYVAKLTTTPGAIERADVDKLRTADFSDTDILQIVEVAGYYSYVNRIASGLGVKLEKED
ncbi:MAG: putative peroxidase-related enzyme [Planctomycetota bacterium]